jgi:hypothetical protein
LLRVEEVRAVGEIIPPRGELRALVAGDIVAGIASEDIAGLDRRRDFRSRDVPGIERDRRIIGAELQCVGGKPKVLQLELDAGMVGVRCIIASRRCDGDRPGRGDLGRADNRRGGFRRRSGATGGEGKNGETCSRKNVFMCNSFN